jgi:hypothetical protein
VEASTGKSAGATQARTVENTQKQLDSRVKCRLLETRRTRRVETILAAGRQTKASKVSGAILAPMRRCVQNPKIASGNNLAVQR